MTEVAQMGLRKVWPVRKGVDSGKILSLPDGEGDAERPERGTVFPEGSGFEKILSLPDDGGGVHG